MMESAAQADYRARRKQDILERITHALPDWSAEQLDLLATQMAELEIRCAMATSLRPRPLGS